MKDKSFDFFQDHSSNFLKMALNVARQTSMAKPDGYGKRIGDCGDTVEIFLKVRANKIDAVSYCVDGCINTHACCNAVAQLIEGKDVNKAWGISPDTVIDYLETLPDDHTHCAELAVGALYLALSGYQELKQNP
jgi:nitrogen fixation NifU-like protein